MLTALSLFSVILHVLFRPRNDVSGLGSELGRIDDNAILFGHIRDGHVSRMYAILFLPSHLTHTHTHTQSKTKDTDPSPQAFTLWACGTSVLRRRSGSVSSSAPPL